MSESPLLQQIRTVVSDVMGVPESSITAASSPESIESWDSVQHLSLVMSLEQALGVQFQPEEIDKLRSVADIERVVASKHG